MCLLQKQKIADGSGAKTREKQHKYLQAKENRRELNRKGAKNMKFCRDGYSMNLFEGFDDGQYNHDSLDIFFEGNFRLQNPVDG